MTAPLAPGLARKVKKVLEIQTESSELLTALTSLSTFYTENTPATRRQLRTTLEQRSLKVNQEYLTAAEGVLKALEQVKADLDGLAAGCGRVDALLASTKKATAGLLTETDRNEKALAASEARSDLVERFLQQYQLSATELDVLQGEDIDERFFAALERVRTIHFNCRSLLRSHHQRAGLELMESMSAHQEAAYERLCRWVQGQCRGLGDMDAPEVGPLLQQAARALRERQVLFKYCAEEVAAARHSALFQRFITALTRGGPGGMPRPIEMHAHDPRRYLGDMLAWVHQSLASERELLTALFGTEDPSRSHGGSAALGGAKGASAAAGQSPATPRQRQSGSFVSLGDLPDVPALLDRVFDSICRPLQVRIEQVLMASPPLLLTFKVSQLLAFYTATVEGLLGVGRQLSQTLAAARQLASRTFQDQLRARGDRLLRFPPKPPANLSAPQQVLEASGQLLEIVAAYESAYQPTAEVSGEREFTPVLAAALDPLLSACQRSAGSLQRRPSGRLEEPEQAGGDALSANGQRMYMANCLIAVAGALGGHPCCQGRVQQLHAEADRQVAELVQAEAASRLSQWGLVEIVERIRLYAGGKGKDGALMATDPALQLDTISAAVQSFLKAMSNPDALPEYQQLQMPRMRSDAVARTADLIAKA
ncbi:hypothetical protein WJX84_005952, partial [Apatococcus fuscideae]